MSAGNGDGPISGICIVADHTRAPPGYTVIRKAYDDPTREADLHRDGLFKRIDRYMCVTRYQFDNVVEDIILINANTLPPSAYTCLDTTVDTNENATSKKTICVRMSPRTIVRKAVGDIIFLSKQKRSPPGYSLLGEINNLMMCYSEWDIEHEPLTNGRALSRNEGYQRTKISEPTGSNVSVKSPESGPLKKDAPRTKHYNNITGQKMTCGHDEGGFRGSLYPGQEVDLLRSAYGNPDNSFDTLTIQRDDFAWSIVSAIPFQFKQLDEFQFTQNNILENEDGVVLPIIDIDEQFAYEFRLEIAWASS